MLNVVAIMGRLARDCCLMWQDDCWNKGCAAIRQAIKILEG